MPYINLHDSSKRKVLSPWFLDEEVEVQRVTFLGSIPRSQWNQNLNLFCWPPCFNCTTCIHVLNYRSRRRNRKGLSWRTAWGEWWSGVAGEEGENRGIEVHWSLKSERRDDGNVFIWGTWNRKESGEQIMHLNLEVLNCNWWLASSWKLGSETEENTKSLCIHEEGSDVVWQERCRACEVSQERGTG